MLVPIQTFPPEYQIHPVTAFQNDQPAACRLATAHESDEILASASFTALITAFHLTEVSGAPELSVPRLYAAYHTESASRVPKKTSAE